MTMKPRIGSVPIDEPVSVATRGGAENTCAIASGGAVVVPATVVRPGTPAAAPDEVARSPSGFLATGRAAFAGGSVNAAAGRAGFAGGSVMATTGAPAGTAGAAA